MKMQSDKGHLTMLRELRFVWYRLICAFRGHDFKKSHEGKIIIVYCARCNWYGGPAGAGISEDDKP
jgi:hypothetical protein